MEPNAQLVSTNAPVSPATPAPQPTPSPVPPAPAAPSVPTSPHNTSYLTLVLLIVAIASIAGAAYLYMKNTEKDSALAEASTRITTLETQLQAAMGKNVTLYGPVTNGAYLIDDAKMIFIDSNGTPWFVNYAGAIFVANSTASSSFKGKFSTRDDWIAAQNTLGGAKGKDVPGRVIIKGALKSATGIVTADSIEVELQ